MPVLTLKLSFIRMGGKHLTCWITAWIQLYTGTVACQKKILSYTFQFLRESPKKWILLGQIMVHVWVDHLAKCWEQFSTGKNSSEQGRWKGRGASLKYQTLRSGRGLDLLSPICCCAVLLPACAVPCLRAILWNSLAWHRVEVGSSPSSNLSLSPSSGWRNTGAT